MDKKEIFKLTQVPLEDWESTQEQETRMLRAMTIRDGLQQYQEMQAAFEWQMQQTAGLFAASH